MWFYVLLLLLLLLNQVVMGAFCAFVAGEKTDPQLTGYGYDWGSVSGLFQ